MPKIKTSRAAAKRFKKTGTGKLKRNKAYNWCYKCKEYEEDFTLFIIYSRRKKKWQELKAEWTLRRNIIEY